MNIANITDISPKEMEIVGMVGDAGSRSRLHAGARLHFLEIISEFNRMDRPCADMPASIADIPNIPNISYLFADLACWNRAVGTSFAPA